VLVSDPRVPVSVPFLDLGALHRPLQAALLADFAALIDSSAFTLGPAVADFERAFAEYCGTRRCVGLSSGLDALCLGLLGAGLEAGDEVIVPANTFVATVEAVIQAGGAPVLVDVSERDYNLDPDAVEAAVGPRTRFMVPVHLYGQMADVRRLARVAARHGLTIVEDACQAHGAARDGLRAGGAGVAAAFSFYPAKNLGGMGDAGALVTGDDTLADVVEALRHHGQHEKNVHALQGYTARLDSIQALVLSRKLPSLDGCNAERGSIAAAYDAALGGVGDLVAPPVPEGSEPVWHLYVVRTADPDALGRWLAAAGIATGRHYPQPIHLSPAYVGLACGPGSFPVAEALANELLSLPIFPAMTVTQVDAVVAGVRSFFA
jgi:dTDP-4-amino-4,6-dideoxygalactose transaminase